MDKLYTVRIKSFLFSLLGFAVTGVFGFLLSADFANLVTEHFGNTMVTTLVLLVVPEVVKHLRNLQVIKQLGSDSEELTLI